MLILKEGCSATDLQNNLTETQAYYSEPSGPTFIYKPNTCFSTCNIIV